MENLELLSADAVCAVSKKNGKPYAAIFAVWADANIGKPVKTVTFLRPWEAAALGLDYYGATAEQPQN